MCEFNCKKCSVCNEYKCPYLYNDDYCLLEEEYLEDIENPTCGVSFSKTNNVVNDYELLKEIQDKIIQNKKNKKEVN